MSVSVSFVTNVVVQHMNYFVVCCVEVTHYKRKVPPYLLVMRHTMLVSVYAISAILFEVQSQDIIIRHLVTSPFKSMYFQIFGKNYCRKTIEATTVKKVLNERKLIHAICNFIIASCCVVFIWSSFKHDNNLNGIFGDVNLAAIGIVIY